MSSTLAVEFSHEWSVRVSNQQDGRTKHLDLFLTALMGLHTDAAATLPIVLLSFKTWHQPIKGLIMSASLTQSSLSTDWIACLNTMYAVHTSVVECAIKVKAASVEARHELDQVPYPGVPCTRKTRKSHKGTGSLRQKHPLLAPGV